MSLSKQQLFAADDNGDNISLPASIVVRMITLIEDSLREDDDNTPRFLANVLDYAEIVEN